jgi:hypothetical protein
MNAYAKFHGYDYALLRSNITASSALKSEKCSKNPSMMFCQKDLKNEDFGYHPGLDEVYAV